MLCDQQGQIVRTGDDISSISKQYLRGYNVFNISKFEFIPGNQFDRVKQHKKRQFQAKYVDEVNHAFKTNPSSI